MACDAEFDLFYGYVSDCHELFSTEEFELDFRRNNIEAYVLILNCLVST